MNQDSERSKPGDLTAVWYSALAGEKLTQGAIDLATPSLILRISSGL
jgi:hypothetical protein